MPLVPRPYAALAVQVGTQETDVLQRFSELRGGEKPVVREISAVLEAEALGYASALVACEVAEAQLDAAGQEVAKHPGVSHCYGREGKLNLWYTLTLGSDSPLGLEQTAALLAKRIGARQSHVLPALHRFKVQVHVDAAGEMNSQAQERRAIEPRPLTELERRTIVALQNDLPNRPQPFDALAQKAELPLERLLATAAELLDRGVIRRYGATLNHRVAGLAANVLVAWQVSEGQAQRAGTLAAEIAAVSHCYLRPAFDGWPYNLYTMIHGRSPEECGVAIDAVAAVTGLSDHVRLWTKKEYKKSRIRYFADDVARWEREHL